MLQRGREPDHFLEAFRLDAFGPSDVLRWIGRNAIGQVRFQESPDFLLARLGEPAGNAPPHDPVFSPDRFFFVKLNAFLEEFEHLFASPVVQRVTESGSQGVASQLEKDFLVVGAYDV